jgi:hypothetical protein
MTVDFDPSVCALCGGSNGCGNLLNASNINKSSVKNTSCWCMAPELIIPEALLLQVPKALKGKACICQSCIKNYKP